MATQMKPTSTSCSYGRGAAHSNNTNKTKPSKNMTNKNSIRNFLLCARILRAEGKGLTVNRSRYGGCTELRAKQHGTTDSVVLYMGVRGDISCSVAFTR